MDNLERIHELEDRIEELEEKTQLLNPSGLTSKNFFTRLLTIYGYQMVGALIFGLIGVVIFVIVTISVTADAFAKSTPLPNGYFSTQTYKTQVAKINTIQPTQIKMPQTGQKLGVVCSSAGTYPSFHQNPYVTSRISTPTVKTECYDYYEISDDEEWVNTYFGWVYIADYQLMKGSNSQQ
jgi:hypothetical protein